MNGGTAILYSLYSFETEKQGRRETTSSRATEVFVRGGGRRVNAGRHLDSGSRARARFDAARRRCIVTRVSRTYLVTGANRGIGFEFARQLARRGDHVIATARDPERAVELRRLGVPVESLDLAEEESVASLAARLARIPLDVLIHNAAVGSAGPLFADLRIEDLERAYRVNAIGPLHLTQALLPNLRALPTRQVIAISSTAGSVTANETRGGWYAYRASKAALNQLLRTLALELQPDGFTVVAVSPGWVRTDMGGPRATLSAAESVEGMLGVVDRLTPADTNRFLDYRGQSLAW
ncbi:MAG: SDR family oxidoreductase [Acidobacteriota bacterium]